MRLTIRQIAEALGVEPLGEAGLEVTGLAEPAAAGPGDLALALSPGYAAALARGGARAAVLWPGADWRGLGLAAALLPARGRLAMAGLTRAFDPGPGWGVGVHPQAIVAEGAELGAGVGIGPFSVIGPGAAIGAGSRLGPQVTVAAGARIGPGALIHAGVRIGPRVRIGRDAVIHPGAVIGADGFSFVTEEVSRVETARHTLGDAGGARAQGWQKIHSLGGVEIGDEVEIGANCTIDYGTIRATRVGDRTKIDNLVHIAHNVVVGADCLLCAQTGIAGSTVVGDFVVMGGQAGVADNLKIGDRVILGGATKVISNVPPGRVMQGYPAVPMAVHVESYKALRRLPRILRRLAGDGPDTKPAAGPDTKLAAGPAAGRDGRDAGTGGGRDDDGPAAGGEDAGGVPAPKKSVPKPGATG